MRYAFLTAAMLLLTAPAFGLVPPEEPAVKSTPAFTVAKVKSGDTLDIPAGGYADITFDVPAGATVLQRFSGTVTQSSRGLPQGRVIFTGVGTVVVMNDVIDFEKKIAMQIDFTVNFGGKPPPVPPGPGPGPQPPPVPPPGPAPDAALVASLKVALAKDVAAGNGTKAKATDLAVVFDTGASLLDVNDPAIAPKTVGELYTKMVLGSVAKGIPRPPYLKETRAVIDVNLPLLNGETMLTPAIKSDFQTKYRAVAAALTEASK